MNQIIQELIKINKQYKRGLITKEEYYYKIHNQSIRLSIYADALKDLIEEGGDFNEDVLFTTNIF